MMDPIRGVIFFKHRFIVLFVSFIVDINSHEKSLESSSYFLENGWLRGKKALD